MKNASIIGKILVSAMWVWGILSFISPESVPSPSAGRLTAVALFVAHAIEALLFTPKLVAQVGGSAANHAIQLLLFGIVHVMGTGAKIGKLGG